MESVESPHVLMLHGFFGHAHNWRACADALSRHARVIVPQLPFFGPRQNRDRIEQVTRFLGQLIQQEESARFVVMGNSLGGQLAVNLAVLDPERVVGLVLTGSSGLYETRLAGKIQRQPQRNWVREHIAEVFCDASHVTETMVDAVLEVFNDRQKAFDALLLAKNIRDTSVRESLPRVRCPVLLVWGEQDTITPPHTAHDFKELLSDAELHFIARCGHAPMMEHPVEFNRLAGDFLRRVSVPKEPVTT